MLRVCESFINAHRNGVARKRVALCLSVFLKVSFSNLRVQHESTEGKLREAHAWLSYKWKIAQITTAKISRR